MKLFNFLNNGKSEKAAISVTLPSAEELTPSTQEVNSVSTIEEQSTSQKPLTVSYATGWPIDVIYGYLHKNYEEQGFNDAMIKSDLAFKDMNMNIIKNKILLVFKEINLNYSVMKNDYQTRIETCSAAGLLSTVSDIEKTMTVIKTHQEELRMLEEDFRNNTNEASVPLQSYECGFLRGIATIALGSTNRTVPLANNDYRFQKSQVSA